MSTAPGPTHSTSPATAGSRQQRSGLLAHRGVIASVCRQRLRGLLTLSPGLLWLTVLLFLPLLGIVLLSFAGSGPHGVVIWQASLAAWQRVAGWTMFGWSEGNLLVLWRSVWLAGLTTGLCLLLALPMATQLARCTPRWRFVLLAILAIPFATNLAVRVYGWQILCVQGGPLPRLVTWLGLADDKVSFYPGLGAVLAGMVSSHLIFTVLPLHTAMVRLDRSLLEAADDLYASPWWRFRHALLPQLAPALVAAALFTAIPALGMFLVTDRLGLGKYPIVGNLIQLQVGKDTPYLAALSLTLIMLCLIAVIALRRWLGRAMGSAA